MAASAAAVSPKNHAVKTQRARDPRKGSQLALSTVLAPSDALSLFLLTLLLVALTGRGTVCAGGGCNTCCHLIGAEHLHFDAAILGARGAVVGFVNRLFVAETDHVDAVDRNVVLRDKVFNDCISAFLAEHFVILRAARLIREAFNGNDEALIGLDVLGELVEIGLVFLGQAVLIQRERNGDGTLELIIVDVTDDAPKAVQALSILIRLLIGRLRRGHGVIGVGHGVIGVIHSVSRMLVGSTRFFIRGADTVLGALVDIRHLFVGVLDLVTILGGLLAYLIYFGLDGSCGVAHILFRSASPREQSARYDARCRKKSFHGQEPRVAQMQFWSLKYEALKFKGRTVH